MKKGAERENNKTAYPRTDLVILAGGQARRMNGINKLLQKFDDQIQLIKIHQQLKSNVAQVWINSHRDYSIYQKLIPSVHYYQDDEPGFQGPLMGMKSAWSHVQSDYVLFVPCDVTYIPSKVLLKLHQALAKNSLAQVAYVEINGKPLYPFCLVLNRNSAVLNTVLLICTHKWHVLKIVRYFFTVLTRWMNCNSINSSNFCTKN